MKLFKFIKRFMLVAVSIIVSLVVLYFLFVNFKPSFGGDVTLSRKRDYNQQSANHNGEKFLNQDRNVPKNVSFTDGLSIAWYFFTTKTENGRPEEDLKVEKRNPEEIQEVTDSKLVWFGHSSFLLRMNGQTIFIDPMLTEVAAPHPWLGTKRFNSELPLDFDEIPDLDAIVISHDHYDHLDYESIKKLKDRTKHFYVPLGVGVHLEAWDVPKEQITELDWWQESTINDIQLICTPAQHFSGRKANNGQSTLWSSWIFKTTNERLYFSGDSGYAGHFAEIGEKYGPFDLALMECGQYNDRWSDIHMMPEETAQAGMDLKAKAIMPIHWAGFKLALHSWKDPIQRVTTAADSLNIPVITPQIGAWIPVSNATSLNDTEWWKEAE